MGEVVSSLFYSDLFTKSDVGSTDQQKDLIKQILSAKENNLGQAPYSNEGCWRSNFEYGNEIDWLREEVKNYTIQICNTYATIDNVFKEQISKENNMLDFKIWTNVNEPNSTNDIHTHKEFSFACTYYLQGTNTGKLTFINPANILNECNLKSPFVRNYSVEPKDGDLFIWPAWIPHKVDRNESDRQRINLAFNINIT
tara:strand:+ start:36 stop:629 length:594 start_codon:yes stop_codon:yes gene_type:complete